MLLWKKNYLKKILSSKKYNWNKNEIKRGDETNTRWEKKSYKTNLFENVFRKLTGPSPQSVLIKSFQTKALTVL